MYLNFHWDLVGILSTNTRAFGLMNRAAHHSIFFLFLNRDRLPSEEQFLSVGIFRFPQGIPAAGTLPAKAILSKSLFRGD